MILGISISRIYRDSHFPSQIVAGILIGIPILWLCIRFKDKIALFMHKLSLGKAWVLSGILPLIFIALTIIMMRIRVCPPRDHIILSIISFPSASFISSGKNDSLHMER